MAVLWEQSWVADKEPLMWRSVGSRSGELNVADSGLSMVTVAAAAAGLKSCSLSLS